MQDLKGIGFKGYRSIGEKPVLLYPLKKVNLFVGPNNCGKSNILRYISTRNTYPDPMTDLDYPNLKIWSINSEQKDRDSHSFICQRKS